MGLFTTALLAAIAAAGGGGDRTSQFTTAGVSVQVPAGWHATARPLTQVGSPVQRLVLTSFALKQSTPDPDCSPVTAVGQLPADGALVDVFEQETPRAPARPAHFALTKLADYECMGRSYQLRFADHGRAFMAHVYLGAKASASTRERVLGALDSLQVQPRTHVTWVKPSTVLAQGPDLGVACKRANTYACDRVGLAVWLKHPAVGVIKATIDGRPLSLKRTNRMYVGYLQPAGLLSGPLKVTADDGPGRYVGRKLVKAGVALRIQDRPGHWIRTSRVVPLGPGWG